MKARALILRAAGTNCDEETAFAFERSGAAAERVHVRRLIERPALLSAFAILCLPGGFTYGDDLSAGKILANRLRIFLRESIERFLARGGLVLGICNGFQVLVKSGLLPGGGRGEGGGGGGRGEGDWTVQATLAANDSGRFEARWVPLEAPPSPCVFTRGLSRLSLPVAHGEGKFVASAPAVLDRVRANRQVALAYAPRNGLPGGYPDNPNGSQDDIAGLSDPTGRILGMMPHPERFAIPAHHPAWTSRLWRDGDGEGLQVFRNAVDSVG